jgi:uncharacterized protein (TIGR02594 family)
MKNHDVRPLIASFVTMGEGLRPGARRRKMQFLVREPEKRNMVGTLATPQSFDDFPWMRFAFEEYGQAEVPGTADNPRIIQYLATCGLGGANDETPWCAGFVNWCLRRAGIAGTGRANARSFLRGWDGQSLSEPSFGSITVFSRPPNPAHGHVAFYTGMEGSNLVMLGGNQGNRVGLKTYPISRVLGYFLPAGFNPVY